jgi:hypothetical protein
MLSKDRSDVVGFTLLVFQAWLASNFCPDVTKPVGQTRRLAVSIRLGGEPPGPISAPLPARVYSIAGLGFEAREYANGQWPDQEHPSFTGAGHRRLLFCGLPRAPARALLPLLSAAAVKCPRSGCIDKAGLDHPHLSPPKTAALAIRRHRGAALLRSSCGGNA